MTSRDRQPREPNSSLLSCNLGQLHPIPDLSIVVPAYNEERRLPATLQAIADFLTDEEFQWEIVVVDDGSDDNTARVATAMGCQIPQIRVEQQPHLGKAAAVKRGVTSSTGANILFTDADLSTPIAAVLDLLEWRRAGADIVIGSREGASADRVGEPIYRHIMGRAFNWIVRLAAVRGIRDTQCGFKLFSRESAAAIFPKLRVSQPVNPIEGPRVSAFDVEILFLARRERFRIREVPVIWTHAPGSKVRPGIDSFRMLTDVLSIRWNALRGKYN